MHRELTTEQFQAAVEQALQNRLSGPNRNLPGMGLAPHFVRCDGPSLQLEVAYETKTWMSNPMGVLHGGMTAVLLDTSDLTLEESIDAVLRIIRKAQEV